MKDWPFEIPDSFLYRLGYRGDQRYVGIFQRDEDYLFFDPQESKLTGNWLFIDYVLKSEMWLLENGIDFSNTHTLLVDSMLREGYILTREDAAPLLIKQELY